MAQVDRENRANLLKKIEVLLGQIDEAIAFNLKKCVRRGLNPTPMGGIVPFWKDF